MAAMRRGEKSRFSFLKSDTFKKTVTDLNAWDDVDDLKRELDADPEAGDPIQESGGLRKQRMGLPGRGKRGGARIIYFYHVEGSLILLLAAYAKNAQADLDKDDLRELRHLRDKLLAKHNGGHHG